MAAIVVADDLEVASEAGQLARASPWHDLDPQAQVRAVGRRGVLEDELPDRPWSEPLTRSIAT